MPYGISIQDKISSDELLRLHWEEGLTLEQIGMTFGYTPSSSRTYNQLEISTYSPLAVKIKGDPEGDNPVPKSPVSS